MLSPLTLSVPEPSFLLLTIAHSFPFQTTNLLTENPTVRAPTVMEPLLQRLSERKPENLDYLGVSYGLTPPLLRCILIVIQVRRSC